jgi:hypothetical protein
MPLRLHGLAVLELNLLSVIPMLRVVLEVRGEFSRTRELLSGTGVAKELAFAFLLGHGVTPTFS